MSILLACGITLTPLSFVLAEDNNIITITGDYVNVRREPNTDSKKNIIGRVNSGDTFTVINHEGDWYLIDYYGEYAYISDSYAKITDKEENIIEENKVYGDIFVAKVTGNNINIRSSASDKSDDNIIGFADMSDYFKILGIEGNWYIIDYLGTTAYITRKYVAEKIINEEDLQTKKMVYLNCDSILCSSTNGTCLTVLPKYQHLAVIKEENGYYRVRVDGVIGYINPRDTSTLTDTFIVSDLARQIVRVYKNNKEVYRAHMISGRKSMQTDIGIFKIGHKLRDYQLTKDNFVNIWIQYNNNEGFHDASWQKHRYFMEVAKDAYDRYAKGEALTYPFSHGSHGCDNLELIDAETIYLLVHVKDNVLVIGPNNLVRDNLINNFDVWKSGCKDNQKVKKLF